MPFKCLSTNVSTEMYEYTLAAGENILLPLKARPGEALIVHCVSVYNNTLNGFTHIYKVMKRRGRIFRLNYQAALATIQVHRWATDIYLIDGDEGGIILTPSAAGDTVQVTFQVIRLIDADFYKST